MASVVVGTAGHIDHGKSALVRALTGIDPDRLKEERARGITIDLGFAHTVEGGVQLAFVDVPGHERFVRNMLAGADGVDAVLLVVAANESVQPQTREHFDICRLLGIGRGVIAVTKADLADETTRGVTRADIQDLVAGSFLAGAPVIDVSVRTREGLPELRRTLASLATGTSRHHRSSLVRLPVDRVFSAKGFGVIVTGTLVSGTLKAGDSVAVLPAGDPARVRGLQIHNASANEAQAPTRVAANLAGIDAQVLSRGVTLATPDSLAVTSGADARIQLLPDSKPLRHGARVRVHHGTTDVLARVSVAAVRPDAGSSWVPSRPGDSGVEVPAGSEGFVRLRFGQPIVLTRGDRFVMRAASPVRTIGGGVVLDPEPGGGGVRRAASITRFLLLDSAGSTAVTRVLLGDAAGRGLDVESLVRRAGLDAAQARAALYEVTSTGEAVRVNDRVFETTQLRKFEAAIEQRLRQFHQEQPDVDGMPRETLRERTSTGASPVLFEAALANVVASGAIRGGDRLSLSSRTTAASDRDRRLQEAVLARLMTAALAPPDSAGLAAELREPAPEIERAVHALVRTGRLVRAGDFAFHPEPLAALRASIRALRATQPPGARMTLDVGLFKTRHGLTRKHAIPLLEWLDRERVTRRKGDVRVIL